MPAIKAATVIRNLAKATRSSPTVFNDRLGDGGRSIKVLGEDKDFYVNAQSALAAHGYKSKVVSSYYKNFWMTVPEKTYRIHVWEV